MSNWVFNRKNNRIEKTHKKKNVVEARTRSSVRRLRYHRGRVQVRVSTEERRACRQFGQDLCRQNQQVLFLFKQLFIYICKKRSKQTVR